MKFGWWNSWLTRAVAFHDSRTSWLNKSRNLQFLLYAKDLITEKLLFLSAADKKSVVFTLFFLVRPIVRCSSVRSLFCLTLVNVYHAAVFAGTELQFSLVHFIKVAPFINATLRAGKIGIVICLSPSISLSSLKRFILFRQICLRRRLMLLFDRFSFTSIKGETHKRSKHSSSVWRLLNHNNNIDDEAHERSTRNHWLKSIFNEFKLYFSFDSNRLSKCYPSCEL